MNKERILIAALFLVVAALKGHTTVNKLEDSA